MNAHEMTPRDILDRMFDRDRHTQFLYEKRKACQSDADRELVDREIREWWFDWKEYQT